MGEDRGIWNLDKCEIVSASRNYYELLRIGRGERDWAEWEGLGGLRLALLLGLTPKHIPGLFYEKYWRRWNGDRIAVTGDYTKADGMIYDMCSTWTDITEVVDLALAELFIYLSFTAQDKKSKKKYMGVALWTLRNRLKRTFTVASPSTIVKLMADVVQETGSLRLAKDEALKESEEGFMYCRRIEEKFDAPLRFYIGTDCLRAPSDYQLEWLDESKVFETFFREDEHLAVPSDIAYAFNAFMRMMEGRPEQEY